MTVKLGDTDFEFILSADESEVLKSELYPISTPAIILDAEKAAAEQVAAEQVAAEQVAAEQAAAEQAAAEQAASEQAASEQAASEQAASEKVSAENAQTEKALAEKVVAERDAAEIARQEKQTFEKTIPKLIENKDTKELGTEKRKKIRRPVSSELRDEYSESKALKIGSAFILFLMIALSTTFLYAGFTRHQKMPAETPSTANVNKGDAKNEAPMEAKDKSDGDGK
jgi:flagellar biosynthesis GTPase FlhF